ncbi:hypothetical protein [Aquimarina sp. AU474]|uniref:hypothetical protein n=1 Tax=Aquimarina sp. AU474 TaxID=2108529 RepID=UPI000D693E5C|nr:hypothetical protein [Aquimarina sp. AU474]
MSNSFQDIHEQLSRQLGHWTQAASRLSRLDELASPESWRGLEHYLNIALKNSLGNGLITLIQNGEMLKQQLAEAKTVEQLEKLQLRLDDYKRKYLRTETMLDFYADAINSRTNRDISAIMRACDCIARDSMKSILTPLGKTVPPVLTYIDKGLGASILKAGLRLWDGKTQSPVAAIKIVRHNLYRPTALIHEAGHQVAHMLHWNEELGQVLLRQLKSISPKIAELWSGWSSEIAADTFAFVHTGYGSVVGLHDVVSGDSKFVFRYTPMDPHPISYLRVLLGIEMCKVSYGKGPWDQMERVWKQKYVDKNPKPQVQTLIKQSIPLLSKIAKICLDTPMMAFDKKPITYWIPPKRVAPNHLQKLVKQAGNALYVSNHWVSNEAIRLLALGGYQVAIYPLKVPQILEQQRKWMLRLGETLQVA